ncbi:aminopeptidase P family protein [Pontivivens insulae]|uniref:Aminopeptidase YpdF n=1 Tax=Pontivivens insulae TaxID=1639689 RepID=A0A2R8AE64_9RHOB|nr:aminopeptidase P family protein [Pontivivens insulae]RED14255.1 Xaa-Pro aminopeptidase [Pontivivens insulae]SPF30330.1 Aminopeptidase YpdF [Pontivivens insulae]
MFQSFAATTTPTTGAARLQALRAELQARNLAGFLVPRADAHQGETVADCDQRLAWLTGFTGSAGHCAVLADAAAVFVDGRYTLQVRKQVDIEAFTPIDWPATTVAAWLADHLEAGRLAYDPWLHTPREMRAIRKALPAEVALVECDNLIDQIWADRPAPPADPIIIHDISLAGETHQDKRARLADDLQQRGASAAVLSLPASIAWLLNIRGSDVPNTPVPRVFAILHSDHSVDLFNAADRLTDELRAHLGEGVRVHSLDALEDHVAALTGKVAIDMASIPVKVANLLDGCDVLDHEPCALPKARKTEAEIAGARAAHLRDGAAMANFLCWLDAHGPSGTLTEIDIVTQLEGFRRATNQLRDISFETISGAGPNGAIVHYRVTDDSNRTLAPGELMLVDSGGQYPDGTTDVTRTVAVGPVDEAAARAFTLVLKGMIAISTLRWPEGLGGAHIDALARAPLWSAGMDYMHGTGHGVGAYLGVHEGPINLSRRSSVPFEPGMILSNEPGYYREGAFGIRIENLIVVEPPRVPDGGDLPMLSFETLTLAPIDRRLIRPHLLTTSELDWLNAYHARVAAEVGPLVPEEVRTWLERACAPLSAD